MNRKDRLFLKEIIKVSLPSFLAMGLFAAVLFMIAIPGFKTNLMDQKKNMIAELTRTAWSILSYYEQQEKAGEISTEDAQALARKHVGRMRYGSEGKDYFWINDLVPVMVIHPYRKDLDGQDLSGFEDPKGKKLFVEFVQVAEAKGEGYVSYMWQWKDDSENIVPKISHVRLFEPWGWIVGTGVYVADVEKEIDAISKKMVVVSFSILIIILFLLLLIIFQSVRQIRKRKNAEAEVERYQNELEELVEERTTKLREALEEVKQLSGFLPICSSCKKIRDDQGYWNQIEEYIRNHSEAEFSHSICPDCLERLYPEFYGKKNKQKPENRKDEEKESKE